jgi:hypothetical protein
VTAPSVEPQQNSAATQIREESQELSTSIQAVAVTDYVQHELDKKADHRHEFTMPATLTTPVPTFSDQPPPDVEPATQESISHAPTSEESSAIVEGNVRRPPHPNRAFMVTLAIAACAGEAFAYAPVGALLGWRHGGGVIPMVILFGILGATWRAITKHTSS